ncbi:MAG TPA: RtcB family protein [Thermoanaerobaculia bacterium]|nr:RtcB family protein [Thermoanaerobaculia bacterium]
MPTLERIDEYLWEVPRTGGMRVPGHIYASPEIVRDLEGDQSPQQVANVAHLPGIVQASLAMPDIHWGYGFPIGGVAATDPEQGGVISPGGVGYDINCGVRVLRTDLRREDLERVRVELVDELFRTVPTGVGSAHAVAELSRPELERVLVRGAEHVVRKLGMGTEDDLRHTEEGGRLDGADPGRVSDRAMERGRRQLGTLGSGNHFLELGVVDEIYLPDVARALGVVEGTVCVLVHCGSRGFGYQVCDDYLAVMEKAVRRYGIVLPDRQLCCAPVRSEEGRAYIGAMACAANYAWANRQTITHLARESFARVLGVRVEELGMRLVYDVCHNIAKFEDHLVDGRSRRLCVHRKGATRAFPPGDHRIPESLREVGQPVLVPGDMGRYSFVLVGAPGAMEKTFGSTCHGAGRLMSRAQAKRQSRGRDLVAEMANRGVTVRAAGMRTVAEEMPHAYKDVAAVVDVMEGAGISNKVFRLKPFGVIKG